MSSVIQGLEEFYEKKKYQDLCNVFKIMNGSRYAVVKGAPLKRMIGKGTSTLYSDVDILIDRKHLNAMTHILNNSGYYNDENRENKIFMLTNSHQTLPYSKVYNMNQKVDINFDIFWGEYEGKRIDIEEFLFDTIEMKIYDVRVKTLTPIKAMIQLILHNYKDMNSIFLLAVQKSIKYERFKDVYYLLKNNLSAIPLNKLYMMSAEYEIIPYVFYVLYYTGQVFHDSVLQQYIDAFRTSEGEVLLNCYGLCANEQKEWKYDFKTRLEADNLYELIKNDLTEKDKEKIAINKRIFMGVSE